MQHDCIVTRLHIPISKRPAIRPPQTTTTTSETDPGKWDPSTTVPVKPNPQPAQTIYQPRSPKGRK